MSYLKRLEIVGVAEDEKPGNYMKRVEVVEVLDSEGNSWEPVPGPDPWYLVPGSENPSHSKTPRSYWNIRRVYTEVP